MSGCSHSCLWCKQQIEVQVYCSGRCAQAHREASEAWPIDFCKFCGKVFNAKGKPQQLFCSVKCSQLSPPVPDDTPPDCVVCGLKSERRSWYCKQHTSTDLFLKEWLEGADGSTKSGLLSNVCRKWFLEQNTRCVGCGLDEWRNAWYHGPIPLEIDHINGVPDDNHLSNLRTLCPTCHSLTDTYKAKNRGRGRNVQAKRAAKLSTSI